jgi:hypothetical protein
LGLEQHPIRFPVHRRQLVWYNDLPSHALTSRITVWNPPGDSTQQRHNFYGTPSDREVVLESKGGGPSKKSDHQMCHIGDGLIVSDDVTAIPGWVY